MKLPETTIVKLEKLLDELKHPKVKKLLKRAIPNWKEHGVCFYSWGVNLNKDRITAADDEGCCLMGSAVIGVKNTATDNYDFVRKMFRPVWAIAGLSLYEIQKAVDLFDHGENSSNKEKYFVNDEDSLFSEEIIKIRNCVLDEESVSENYRHFVLFRELRKHSSLTNMINRIDDQMDVLYDKLSEFEIWLAIVKR